MIIKSSKTLRIANIDETSSTLKPGVYLLKFDEMRHEYYFQQKENFKLPKKIYGNYDVANRWLKSYENNSEKNMGIILSGLKGTGKTIDAQKFCILSKKPVILINEPFHGSDFIDFLTNPEVSESIVFIDEFEKIYETQDNDKTSDILSLFDGNYATKLIFLLTVNDMSISEYLVNRLGRIKFRKHYTDLDVKIIDEVIEDLLINKNHKESIHLLFEKLGMSTFDILTNVIKEMNLFDEDALEVAKHLNLKPHGRSYNVDEIINDMVYECYMQHSITPDEREIIIERRTTIIGEEHFPYQEVISMNDSKIERINGISKFRIKTSTGKEFIFREVKENSLVI